MLLDARTLPNASFLKADVCIVGGGVAGLTLARELAGHSLKILLLESGGEAPGGDERTRALDKGETAGFPYYPLHTARARGLSGSSALWHVPLGDEREGCRVRPLDSIDFEARDGVPHSGWPFAKAHLDPFYTRAQDLCRLGPTAFDAATWSDETERPALKFADDSLRTIVYKFCLRERFTDEIRDEVVAAGNITTCLHATALEIVTDAVGGTVTRLRVGSSPGHEFTVTARRFVLAAGGIEIPRLMLLSNAADPRGIGNAHDLVGRFFMEHLHFWSGVLVPHSDELFKRTRLYKRIHHVDGVPVIGKLALSHRVLRERGLLNQNIQLIPMRMPDPFRYPRLAGPAVESLRALIRGEQPERKHEHLFGAIRGWGQFLRAGAKRARAALVGLPERRVFIFANMTEQVPNPHSRVTLSDACDAFGLRQPRLNWELDPRDTESVREAQKFVASIVETSGIGRVYRELTRDIPARPSRGPHDQWGIHGGYHHMGTTRMHSDPRQGVVDADSRVHGIDNLYIAGPSVFPTGGYANPVLTIVALAIRLADQLRADQA